MGFPVVFLKLCLEKNIYFYFKLNSTKNNERFYQFAAYMLTSFKLNQFYGPKGHSYGVLY